MSALPLPVSFVPNENILMVKSPYVITNQLHPKHNNPKILVAHHYSLPEKPLVVKRTFKNHLSDLQYENVKRGATIHKLLGEKANPGIAKFYDFFEDSQCFYLIMESLDGDLIDMLEQKEQKRLPEDEARVLFKKIIDILMFIHSNDVAHRDIKLDNFLVCWKHKNNDTDGNDSEGGDKLGNVSMGDSDSSDDWNGSGIDYEVKLTDFDLSDFIHLEPFDIPCGSPPYAAPELCLPIVQYHGTKLDIWSIGIMLYVLVCGTFPWYDPDMVVLFDMIRSKPLQLPSHLSVEIQDLLRNILEKDHNKRYTLHQIFRHPWVCCQR